MTTPTLRRRGLHILRFRLRRKLTHSVAPPFPFRTALLGSERRDAQSRWLCVERRCGKKVIFFSEGRTSESTAKFFCIGRDIEYRELTLERNAENVWELVSDSRTQPELLGGRIVILLSELMRDRTEFIGTPTELSAQIDPAGSEGITPKKVSRLILQSVAALSKIGISAVVRRSNGKRLIELRRAESDDTQDTRTVDPIDPADVSGGENAPCFAL